MGGVCPEVKTWMSVDRSSLQSWVFHVRRERAACTRRRSHSFQSHFPSNGCQARERGGATGMTWTEIRVQEEVCARTIIPLVRQERASEAIRGRQRLTWRPHIHLQTQKFIWFWFFVFFCAVTQVFSQTERLKLQSFNFTNFPFLKLKRFLFLIRNSIWVDFPDGNVLHSDALFKGWFEAMTGKRLQVWFHRVLKCPWARRWTGLVSACVAALPVWLLKCYWSIRARHFPLKHRSLYNATLCWNGLR